MLASVDGGPQEKATVVEEPEDLLELATECRRRLKGLLHAVYCYSDDQPKSSVASGTPSDCDDEVDQVLEERYEHHMDTIERSCGLEDLHAYLLVFGPCLQLQQSPVSCGISLVRYLRYQLDLLHAARVASGELSQKAEEHHPRRPLSALQELCILPQPSEVDANPEPQEQSTLAEHLDEDTSGGDGVCLPPVSCEPPVVPREPLESDLMLELLNDNEGGNGGLSTGTHLHYCPSDFFTTSRLWPPRRGSSSSSAAAAAAHTATPPSLMPPSALPGTLPGPPDDPSSSYTSPGSMAQERDTLQQLCRQEQVHEMLDEKLNTISDTKPPMGGVCYDNSGKAWIAYWTERKSLRSKRFKVRELGFEQARLQAIQCRRYWGRNRRKATVLAPADQLSAAAATSSSLHAGVQASTGSLTSEGEGLARGANSCHRIDGRATGPAPNIYSFLGAFEGTSSQAPPESRTWTVLDGTPPKWFAEDEIVERRPSSIDTGQLTDDGRRALSRGIKMADLYGESDSTDDFVDESAVEELEEEGACEWQNSDDEDDYSCYAAAEGGRAEEEEEDVQRGPAYHHSFSIGKGVRYSTFSDTWVGDMMFRGRRLTQHFAVKKLGWDGAKASAIKWRQDMETLASQSR